jgi:hypothetical protein
LREEPNPGEELDFTHFAGLRREVEDGFEDLLEEGDKTTFPFGWRAFQPCIPFTNCTDTEGNSTAEGD